MRSRQQSPDPPLLKLLNEITFDAIISDFQMPEMNGIALLRKIRPTSDIPFILFTGKGTGGGGHRCDQQRC